MPTADGILSRTGGSKTTVSRHLHEISANSPSSATPPTPPSAPPSEEVSVELPPELQEAADGLSRTFTQVLTKAVAAERRRTMQLLAAEVAARSDAVATARAEAETLRKTCEERREQAQTDFNIAAAEVEALQQIVATLLAAVDLEASDDINDLSAVTSHAVNLIREWREVAAHMPMLEANLERWKADFLVSQGHVEELREAVNQAIRKNEKLCDVTARVRELEVAAQASKQRIAELSVAATAGAEAIGRAKALEQVVVYLTEKLNGHNSTASIPTPIRSRSAKHTSSAVAVPVVKDASDPTAGSRTSSVDQTMLLADQLLAVPPSTDGESPTSQPAPPKSAT